MNLPVSNINQVPAVCRMLRTKMAMGNFVSDDHTPWELAESGTANYWCVCTMTPAGPDDHFAHPQECQEGRRCYQARL